eukprot:Platyproteum_vivax@DN7921_c0_g1_i1.p1
MRWQWPKQLSAASFPAAATRVEERENGMAATAVHYVSNGPGPRKPSVDWQLPLANKANNSVGDGLASSAKTSEGKSSSFFPTLFFAFLYLYRFIGCNHICGKRGNTSKTLRRGRSGTECCSIWSGRKQT